MGKDHGPGVVRSGRYEGGNDAVNLVLRVDRELGIISGDLNRMGPTADGRDTRSDYVVSLRTEPGRAVQIAPGSFTIIGEDTQEQGHVSTGTLLLAAGDGTDRLTVTLQFDRRLGGLPFRRPIEITVDRSSEHLRDLAVELETESGVSPIGDFSVNGSTISLQSVLKDAGFVMLPGGLASDIPAKPSGWDDTEVNALLIDLNRLMAKLAAQPMLAPAWQVSLLLLSRSVSKRLGGIMFDLVGPLPRQGLAVFATTIRELPGITNPDRKLIQTTTHELGHALNLLHRFERKVGRADSLSHMQYDSRYKLGGHRDEFWERYRFRFDPDELSFIRHGIRADIIPGGRPFGSSRYWADGDGGYVPYFPEVPLPWFQLRLAQPPTPFFQFGQPVFLEMVLRNNTAKTIDVPKKLLDPKGDFVEVLIRRHRSDNPTGLRDAELFVPLVQRCYEESPDDTEPLGPGATVTENLNLTFGSSGFSFAEPGFYDVTALVVIPATVANQLITGPPVRADLVVSSNVQRIQVAYPTRAEEHDLADLLDEEVGTYFALGGSPALDGAAAKLARIQERRGDDPADPIVANIIRCRGINAQRNPVRYDATTQKFRVIEADLEETVRQLERLDEPALANFDDTTARATRELAQAVKLR
jgi:hypothetical protein